MKSHDLHLLTIVECFFFTLKNILPQYIYSAKTKCNVDVKKTKIKEVEAKNWLSGFFFDGKKS